MICAFSPNGAGDTHDIASGARRLDLAFGVDWGDADVRASSDKPLTFCSFKCLSGWAAAKALEHDGHTLTEGKS